MRIQKFMAEAGVGSRRFCEKLIEAGRVTVNGEPAKIGMSVDPAKDKLALDGKPIQKRQKMLYWMMNKPEGLVTTVSDPGGRPTVMSLVPKQLARMFPVGRLDRDTHGLLLFTNDGELAHRLLHPSRGVWKRYVATIGGGVPKQATINELKRGIELTDGKTAPCRAWYHDGKMYVELKEGKKRQVRRMLGAVGHPVIDLERVAFGPLHLGDLPLGQMRSLRTEEIAALRKVVGLL